MNSKLQINYATFSSCDIHSRNKSETKLNEL